MSRKMEIIKASMVLIGANPINNTSEGTEGVVAEVLYESTYRALISSYAWRFATKKTKLSKLTDEPLNSYKYTYQLPADTILVVGTMHNSDYEIYEDKLYSNWDKLEIDYRFRVNETNLPPHFVTTFQYLLASKFAIPITENAQKAQLYANEFERELLKAKYADGSSRPAKPMPNPLADAVR